MAVVRMTLEQRARVPMKQVVALRQKSSLRLLKS
jgi:hypothetical protein